MNAAELSIRGRDRMCWTPRILCLLFAAFISLFALDVFEEHRSFWNIRPALSRQLIPTGLLLVLLALAWRWEWVGALGFGALAFFYPAAFWGRFPWATYVIIAGPLLIVSGLFLASWRCQTKFSPTPPNPPS